MDSKTTAKTNEGGTAKKAADAEATPRGGIKHFQGALGNRSFGKMLAPERLPGELKSGLERLSGESLDDVTVQYNSPQPSQVDAAAFARGPEIHLGPGKDRHLPHEAWHVVQQKQGRVKPTGQAGGMAINDDRALEREADASGRIAARGGSAEGRMAGASPAAGPQVPQQPVAQLCKDAEKVVGDETDFEAQKDLLFEYVGELEESIRTLRRSARIYSEIANGLLVNLDKVKSAHYPEIATYIDLVDSVTEGYSKLKAGTHPGLGKPGGKKTKKINDDDDGSSDQSEEDDRVDRPIDERAVGRLKLTGNARPIRAASLELVEECAQTFRALKQDLLNHEKFGMASIRLTETYHRLKAYVAEKAQQKTDNDTKEYYTMLQGGLVTALMDAEKAMKTGDAGACNDELARMLEEFLKRNASRFKRF
jgi:hypothetical protein